MQWIGISIKYFNRTYVIIVLKVVDGEKTIKLSQVRVGLCDVNVKTSCCFNIKTNEILWHVYFNVI